MSASKPFLALVTLAGWTAQHHCNDVGNGVFILDNQDLQGVGHDSKREK